jgi:hypothetical protein
MMNLKLRFIFLTDYNNQNVGLNNMEHQGSILSVVIGYCYQISILYVIDIMSISFMILMADDFNG